LTIQGKRQLAQTINDGSDAMLRGHPEICIATLMAIFKMF